jgi:hypothetical protein
VSVSNGVKQGGILSAYFFCVYIDELFSTLKKSGYGCYIANIFVGSFGCADDIVLPSPTVIGMQKLLNIVLLLS